MSSCPVCCFGYFEYNWIPASCGHAYHPACLFPLISVSVNAPKCMSCGQAFTPEWLRLWGFKSKWQDLPVPETLHYERMVIELKGVYALNSRRLHQRRQAAMKLNAEAGLQVLDIAFYFVLL